MISVSNEVSTHRKVIEAIHKNYQQGAAFALRDIVRTAGVSGTSVVRALKTLKTLRLVTYSKNCYAGRHYRIAAKWPGTADEAIKTFEFARILKI